MFFSLCYTDGLLNGWIWKLQHSHGQDFWKYQMYDCQPSTDGTSPLSNLLLPPNLFVIDVNITDILSCSRMITPALHSHRQSEETEHNYILLRPSGESSYTVTVKTLYPSKEVKRRWTAFLLTWHFTSGPWERHSQ